jgi:gliding motility-associated-like protein
MLICISATPQVSADFTTINSTTGCGSLVVEFKDLSLGNPTAWLWDFGNGNTSTLENPIAIYSNVGSYDVVLIVYDSLSSNEKISSTYINVHEEPVAAFQVNSPANGCVPLTSSFLDLSVTNTSVVSWQWDFGDGGSSNLQNPVYTYLNDGNYSVSLSVIDINGCQNLVTEIDLLEIISIPVADFTYDISLSCDSSDIVSFENNTIIASSFIWDFGDGTTSNMHNPIHNFSTGIFSIALYANNNGCVDTLLITDAIEIMGLSNLDFTVDTNSGCEGLSVSFLDLTNDYNTFLWDFGDGLVSTLQNPTHIFDSAGLYDISLTASISGYCSENIILPTQIEVFESPVISFEADNTLGCAVPFDVMFLENTLDASYWSWNFGDGSSSNIQNPLKTYFTTGIFDVSLLVENSNGCISNITFTNYINVDQLPEINFNATPIVSCAGESISFTDLSSIGNTDWHWYFGDGYSSDSQHPIHEFTLPGFYDISLISGLNLCNDTLVLLDYINIIEPAALFEETYSCYEPLRVEFENLSIGADEVFWDFGDGTTSTLLNPIHDFLNLGIHTVTLYVNNYITGCSNVFSKNIELTQPIADFDYLLNANNSYEDSVGCVPKRVYLNQQSQDCSYYKVLWSDGYVGYGRVDHLFTDEGIFDVSMIITDIHGCKDTATIEDMYHIYDVTTDFSISNISGCDSMLVEFNDMSNHPLDEVKWDFGDGNYSSFNNPQNTYYIEGEYDVSLYIRSIYGCKDTIKKLDYIKYQRPSAEFISNISDVCKGDQVQFFNLSDGIGISSIWDFGDGAQSNLMSPNHEFNSNGVYDINLFIIDSLGCFDSLTLTSYIQVLSPIADFSSLALTSNCPPLISDFTNLSSSDAIYFEWSFGDSSISNIESPTHLFSNSGLFDVSLIVENTFGCRDTFLRNDYIDMQGEMPMANFEISDTMICKNDIVSFLPSSVNVSSFLWDFGNGVTSNDSIATALYMNAGLFIPTLIVENSSGCKLMINNDDSIFVNEVIVDAGENIEICGGHSIELNAFGNGNHINWIPANIFSDVNINNPIVTPIVSSFLYLNHSIGQCSALDSIFITVHNDIPVSNFTAANFCNGDLTSFEANSGLNTLNNSYIWSFGQNGQLVNSVLNLGVNNISLIIENLNNSCKDTSNQVITIFPNPEADFLVSNTCLGEAVHLTGNSSDSVMIWTYDFDDGIGTSSNQNVSYNYAASGNYNVTLKITSDMGCKDSISKNITIYETPVSDFSIENHCEEYGNQFIDHSTIADGDISLIQFDFNDGSISNDSVVTHVFNGYGSFDVTLFAISDEGCIDSVIKTTKVFAKPIVDFMAENFCKGDQTMFENKSFVPYGEVLSYDWNFGSQGSSNIKHSEYTFLSDGVFDVKLSVVSNRGCESYSRKDIVIHKIPSVDFQIESDICIGDEMKVVYLSGINDSEVKSWYYTFGDGNSSNMMNPNHVYNYVSTFNVGLEVMSFEGCQNDTLMPEVIETHNYPIVSFTSSRVIASELYPIINFYNHSKDATFFEWNFDNGEYSFKENPSVSFNSPKVYNVSLTASNDAGCISKIHEAINIKPHYTFFVPDAFTPNGDGINDVFLAKGNRISSFEMQVFDRWGAVVFESSSIYSGWNGNSNIGNELGIGIYLYNIVVYDLNEKLWVYNGELDLSR